MKAWRLFVFIGACLLLADISTVLALTPALEKEKSAFQTATSAENFLGEPAEPKGYTNIAVGTAQKKASKIAPIIRKRSLAKTSKVKLSKTALHKKGAKELAERDKPFGKYAIPCSTKEDCPEDSKCQYGEFKSCWCKNKDLHLRAKSDEKGHSDCIDLKDPCGNEKYPPCHRDATCEDLNNITFLCICNKGFLGDGLTCEKKPGFTNIFYSDEEQEPTAATVVQTTERATKPTTEPQLQDYLLKKTKSIYNKAYSFVMKNLGLVIVGAACVGLLVLTIMYCLCKYEAIISI